MRPFVYERPTSVSAAIAMASRVDAVRVPPTGADTQFIAGGTNLADYMKLGVARPDRLLELNTLAEPALRQIRINDDTIRFGALVRMGEAADNDDVRRRCPALADSLKFAASGQLRNMASLGGNVLQRTRCEYFREISWPCNKREPGSGCAAMEGSNRQHAVLGTSDACIATYHGDFAQALVALDATVEIEGPRGGRTLAFAKLHKRPGDTPDIETDLAADELITAIEVRLERWSSRSRYLKIRDRESYAFALASAAVALDMDGETVRSARIALGGVATVPWRAREAEDALQGKVLDEAAAQEAAEAAFADARPREHNAFKIPLGKRTLVRALLETRDMKG
ncbi:MULTISPECIES: xanthine dehydrogenase family protein subunit M [unclassified Mesorhizobium]|uniref:FAD binding domain-containing protein n=1 Tax=unclassified Mesorhizobium TaxID=325217 RepID=UPI000FCBC5A2|nr:MULTISPECIES: xanthine dehydrogenase family protein subunit M [unclassified Mesorhizobium]RUZ69917.1 xanthine dehydrogenase family protein subunit M [Mesorhizobium sp. M7A.F.Ca.US.003.02.2.1]RUY98793.1 xanthine dehydrogenase family protein subunit M [Mesorhizobium sp. M7A.F.Ca.CA.001.12.2.1]RUZ20229.1 xanthine dehydrogenase family protein subunit M [Mesorhizobium sp. M7A.F.Ca.US.007.01.2.1]RUZ46312.1 xanthine dehydrogenase family protein subunit M [Mesorhizobium sp. M7A.F.Ca.US.003.02.1.1]R